VNLCRQQASDAGLELAVLGSVDERVDATAEQHHHHAEVVQPARVVDVMHADDTQTEYDRVE